MPKAFTHASGKLTGVTFEKVKAEYDAAFGKPGRRKLVPTGEPDMHYECDDVLVAVGQENAFPWIERDIGIEFDKWGMPVVDKVTMQSSLPNVFFGGDSAFGPKNIIWAVAHGHDAAISIDKLCHGEDVTRRPPPMVNLTSQKMGIHEWSYDNDISNDQRYKVPLKEQKLALKNIKVEVELGFDAKLALAEAGRCLNCDAQTVFSPKLCIECDACVDICPMDCITFTANGDEKDLRTRLNAPARNLSQDIYVSDGLKTGRIMAKDEDVCLHCGLCAERCPTSAWDMQKFLARHDSRRAGMPQQTATESRMKRIEATNNFVVKFANVNGSGSASANELFARAILRMGVPVSPRNIFPSNIQGLPTWYEVRVNENGYQGRRGGVDLMVAMNPQTWDADLKEIEAGGYVFYDNTKPLPKSKFRDDVNVIGMPLTDICNATYNDPRQRQLFKNIIYVGALSALLEIDPVEIERLFSEQYKGKEALLQSNVKALRLGRDYAQRASQMPARPAREARQTASATRFSSTATARRRSAPSTAACDGVRVVPDNAFLVARRGIHQALPEIPRRPGHRQEPLCDSAGRGRTRFDRDRDRRRLERRARVHCDLRARHLADDGIHRARLFRGNPGGDHRRAARRAVDRHADAHPAVGPALVRLRLARRHQARAAVPRGSDRVLRVCGESLRPRRPAADAGVRDDRSRHRHEYAPVRAAEVG